jgi:hypothetical protein
MWALLILVDVNECAIRTDNCGENSICVNTPGSFKCRCKNGFYKESGSGHCIKGTMSNCNKGVHSLLTLVQ